MRGIFGLYRRDGQPAPADVLSAMGRRMHGAGREGARVWQEGACGVGQVSHDRTADAPAAADATWPPPPRLTFVCAARLDGRDELCDELDVPRADRAGIRDDELVLRAYVRWGESCPRHLLGDWSCAAWHADERRLFIARDETGTGTIYTFVDARQVAFASNLSALLALPAVSSRLDELHLARMLTAWPAPDSTIYRDVVRLPRGHAMTASDRGVAVQDHGSLESVAPLRLATDQEYVDHFHELFSRAVADRLRTTRPLAIALSGGLDSGAVAATAARVRPAGAPAITAIGHVPQFRGIALRGRLGDEAPLIAATARASGIGEVVYLDSASVTPLQGMHRALAIQAAPTRTAANLFWLLDLLATAKARGCGRLLTGQLGNVTISWPGIPAATDWRTHWHRGAWRSALVALLPGSFGDRLHAWRRRARGREPWRAYSAIDPAFARRLDLTERMAAERHDPTFSSHGQSPREVRLRMLRASRGEFAEAAFAHGLDVVDPTADLRVARFCLSIPEAQFIGPPGESRWLIRRAMAGVLPRTVLENRRRGLQAADLVRRFRASASEVEETLASVAHNPVTHEYLDLAYLRRAWHSVRLHDDLAAQRRAFSIVGPGLMLALFLQHGTGKTVVPTDPF